ncbi:MAG: hypothetical protein ACI82F_002673 [Planctomycetota bacterium]|jgi:hypothetical protein
MKPAQATEKVIKLVEEQTGLPVHVEPDPNLPSTTLASVQMARGRTRLHQVLYQPASTQSPDYLIVQQCGFILRLYSVAPEQRFDLTSAPQADAAITDMIAAHPGCQGMAREAVPHYVKFLRDTVMMQLRSIPIGLRVDRWVMKEFPELDSLQRQAVRRQLQDAASAVQPKVRESVPEPVFAANSKINAAFAAFWSECLDEPPITLPYKSAGFLEGGLALLKTWREIPEDPSNDRALVEAWAEALGFEGWCCWQPYTVQ